MIPPTQNESSTSASTFGLKKGQKVSNKTQKTQIKSSKKLKITYKQGWYLLLWMKAQLLHPHWGSTQRGRNRIMPVFFWQACLHRYHPISHHDLPNWLNWTWWLWLCCHSLRSLNSHYSHSLHSLSHCLTVPWRVLQRLCHHLLALLKPYCRAHSLWPLRPHPNRNHRRPSPHEPIKLKK